MDNSMINTTGLWLNKDKNNNSYMAGNCGALRFWVFKNRNKVNDKDPDYLLKISQNTKINKRSHSDDDLDIDSDTQYNEPF